MPAFITGSLVGILGFLIQYFLQDRQDMTLQPVLAVVFPILLIAMMYRAGKSAPAGLSFRDHVRAPFLVVLGAILSYFALLMALGNLDDQLGGRGVQGYILFICAQLILGFGIAAILTFVVRKARA